MIIMTRRTHDMVARSERAQRKESGQGLEMPNERNDLDIRGSTCISSLRYIFFCSFINNIYYTNILIM